MRTGDQYARAQRTGQAAGLLLKLQLALAERMVLKKLRTILGANLRFMISGSAPMPVWLLEWFHAMKLPILETYGLSENIIPVSLNRPEQFRFGSVGRPLPGCEVRLADDGELLVRGPGVFSGYFGEAAAEARIDSDGFLASGDYAKIDADGYINLIGRKSEIFKTSNGHRVAPASIENLLRQLQHVKSAAVFGAGRTLPTALLVVSAAAWQEDRRQLCNVGAPRRLKPWCPTRRRSTPNIPLPRVAMESINKSAACRFFLHLTWFSHKPIRQENIFL